MAKIKWRFGQVIWFDEYSGEGEVRAEDGRDFFVHYSAIESNEKWKKLNSAQKVKFSVSRDPRRRHITRIKEV